ncbi:MAG: aldehyde dehydrogenase, middle subunit [Acidobacteria bacterium]|nr:aldehyde dehydrogenase, middle subunit [Acidobacteriota bacterium]
MTQTQIAASPLIREKYAGLAQAAEKVGSVHVRNLGTVGGSVCHADPAADSPPALLALQASVKAVSRRGERMIALDGFFRDSLESVLEPDELLSHIVIPAASTFSNSVYLKHAARAVDRATVGVSIWWTWDAEEKCRDIRIGLTGAGPTPLRPLSGSHAPASYRRKMVAVFVRRALGQLASHRSAPGEGR